MDERANMHVFIRADRRVAYLQQVLTGVDLRKVEAMLADRPPLYPRHGGGRREGLRLVVNIED